jgi:hypothetical protein
MRFSKIVWGVTMCLAAAAFAAGCSTGVDEAVPEQQAEPVGEVQQELWGNGALCIYDSQCNSGHCCAGPGENRCGACCTSDNDGCNPRVNAECEGSCNPAYAWWVAKCCLQGYHYCPYTDQCYSTLAACQTACAF